MIDIWMYLCLYVCECKFVCVHMCVCACVRMFVRIHIYIYLYNMRRLSAHTYVYIHTFIYITWEDWVSLFFGAACKGIACHSPSSHLLLHRQTCTGFKSGTTLKSRASKKHTRRHVYVCECGWVWIWRRLVCCWVETVVLVWVLCHFIGVLDCVEVDLSARPASSFRVICVRSICIMSFVLLSWDGYCGCRRWLFVCVAMAAGAVFFPAVEGGCVLLR